MCSSDLHLQYYRKNQVHQARQPKLVQSRFIANYSMLIMKKEKNILQNLVIPVDFLKSVDEMNHISFTYRILYRCVQTMKNVLNEVIPFIVLRIVIQIYRTILFRVDFKRSVQVNQKRSIESNISMERKFHCLLKLISFVLFFLLWIFFKTLHHHVLLDHIH